MTPIFCAKKNVRYSSYYGTISNIDARCHIESLSASAAVGGVDLRAETAPPRPERLTGFALVPLDLQQFAGKSPESTPAQLRSYVADNKHVKFGSGTAVFMVANEIGRC